MSSRPSPGHYTRIVHVKRQGDSARGVELHCLAVELCKQIYTGLPSAKDGFIALPEAPGLGFELQRDAVRELVKLPLSQGRGKG
jgi:L-alanine-DL-glutamate epimerase-like enolase superfamily enzyme